MALQCTRGKSSPCLTSVRFDGEPGQPEVPCLLPFLVVVCNSELPLSWLVIVWSYLVCEPCWRMGGLGDRECHRWLRDRVSHDSIRFGIDFFPRVRSDCMVPSLYAGVAARDILASLGLERDNNVENSGRLQRRTCVPARDSGTGGCNIMSFTTSAQHSDACTVGHSSWSL